MKSLLALLVLGISLAIMPACEDEPERPPIIIDDCFDCTNQPWQVLNGIELAYSRRSIYKYDQLLDDDFTFFLSTGDVGGGLPQSWERDVEVQANSNLFSTDQPPASQKRVLSIDMDIQWEDDEGKPNVTWIDFVPENSSETWYTTTVKYVFKIDVEGDLSYINNPGSQVQFTVRNAGTVETPLWKLVEMHDLGASSGPATTSSSTEPSTWGSVKSLYR